MKILKMMCGYFGWLEVTDSRLGGVRIQGEEAVYTWGHLGYCRVRIHSLYIQGWLYCRIESLFINIGIKSSVLFPKGLSQTEFPHLRLREILVEAGMDVPHVLEVLDRPDPQL